MKEIIIFTGVSIGFDPDVYSVDETTGQVTFSVSVLEGTLERPVEVIFSTTDGSATSVAPIDFVSISGAALQFDQNTLTVMVTVTIVDDAILENTENFFGNLITSDSAVDLGPDSATVNILEIGDGKEKKKLQYDRVREKGCNC